MRIDSTFFSRVRSPNFTSWIALLIVLLPIISGCFKMPQSVTDYSLNALSSFDEFEKTTDSKGRFWRDTRITVTTERNGVLAATQTNHLISRGDGESYFQENELRVVVKDNEVRKENRLLIRNSTYWAEIEFKETQPVLIRASNELFNSRGRLHFNGVPVFEIAQKMLELSAEVHSDSNVLKLFYQGHVDDNENSFNFKTLCITFEKINSFWLPKSIESTYFPSNATESDRSDYVWSTKEVRPTLLEKIEVTRTRIGTKRSTHLKTEMKEFEDFDRSRCYLSFYGLPEPAFSSRNSSFGFFQLLIAFAVVVLAILIFVFFKKRYHPG